MQLKGLKMELEETEDQQSGSPDEVYLYSTILSNEHVSSTYLSLLMGYGTIGFDSDPDRTDRDVLIHAVEMRVTVSANEQETSSFVHCIPVDNAAFFLSDYAYEFQRICRQLATSSKFPVATVPNQLERIRNYLQTAQSRVNNCLEIVTEAMNQQNQF